MLLKTFFEGIIWDRPDIDTKDEEKYTIQTFLKFGVHVFSVNVKNLELCQVSILALDFQLFLGHDFD